MIFHFSRNTVIHTFRGFTFILIALLLGIAGTSLMAQYTRDVPAGVARTDGAVILIAPVSETVITDPVVMFSWNAVPNASKYRLEVRGASGFRYKTKVNATACIEGVCSFSTATTSKWQPPVAETLYWTVSAKIGHDHFDSDEWSLIFNLLPDPVLLISPDLNATFTSTLVTFSWQNDTRVDLFKLSLQPGNISKTLNIKVDPVQSCDETTCTVTVDLKSLSEKVFNGDYSWRVIASREGVKAKTKSEKRSFALDLFPALVLEYPTDNQTVAISSPEFMWIDPLVIEKYRIVAVGQANGTITTDWYTANDWCDEDDCYTDTLVLPNDVYQWHVEGRIGGIDGKAISPSWKLTVFNPEATPEVHP